MRALSGVAAPHGAAASGLAVQDTDFRVQHQDRQRHATYRSHIITQLTHDNRTVESANITCLAARPPIAQQSNASAWLASVGSPGDLYWRDLAHVTVTALPDGATEPALCACE